MEAKGSPEGKERRGINRIAYELMKTCDTYDEFFGELQRQGDAYKGFSNFPRRIFEKGGYLTAMNKEFLDMFCKKGSTIDTILGEKPKTDYETAVEANIAQVKKYCGEHRQRSAEIMSDDTRDLHAAAWNTLESTRIAVIKNPLGMTDFVQFADTLQHELEMREMIEDMHRKDNLLRGTALKDAPTFVGNMDLFAEVAKRSPEMLQALYLLARELVLNRQFEFDQIW